MIFIMILNAGGLEGEIQTKQGNASFYFRGTGSQKGFI